ncbi:MAG: hypothetical protein JWQ72_447 [Polaromonas sp.]|nr:hypothetical protein [Polaromonas sp.]
MNVVNVHQRLLYATPEQVGALIDSLGSPANTLWPGRPWPRMKLDRPLAVGAVGRHGLIRYVVEAYTPGQSVRFRLTSPRGFDGWHGFEVLEATQSHCVLEHRIEIRAHGRGFLTWAFAIRQLHDACVEDLLSQAQRAVGNTPQPAPWPAYVRLLMWVMSGGKASARAKARGARPAG